jgi:serine/threonine-protein kinase
VSDLREWPDADRILDEALELPPAEREPFLRNAAAGDARLFAALERIIAESAAADGFLEPGGALTGGLGEAVGRALEERASAVAGQIDPVLTAETVSRRRQRLAYAATTAAFAVGIVIGAAGLRWLTPPRAPAPAPTSRFIVPLPAGDEANTSFQPVATLSPDGRMLVYRARRGGVTQLFLRRMDSLDPQPIPGTENATSAFFSPDGRWLGFDSDGVLKRMTIEAGTPVTICPAPGNATAAWLPDDTIVFATNTGRVLQRVPASGGQPRAITSLDEARGDTMHLLPQALDDGRTVLFTIVGGASRHVAALRLDSGRSEIIVEGSHGTYVEGGHLVYWRDGMLWGARFDAARLALTGRPAPLASDIEQTDGTVLHFTTSRSGSMAYLPAGEMDATQRLVWVDRNGGEHKIGIEPRAIQRIALSPDGTRAALAITERDDTDIWIADLASGATSRVTFQPPIDTMPVWSPDGRTVVFRSEREGPGVFRRDALGAGPVERLTRTDGPIHSPYSWSPDGRTLFLAVFHSFRHQTIASVVPPDPDVRILLDGDFAQLDPQLSPNGRWMAYQSDESGRFEIYVRPYPDLETSRVQVSTDGGASPRWNPNGRELFYHDNAGLMTVAVSTERDFTHGAPARLFARPPTVGRLGPDFDVSPDGQRFLFLADREPDPAHVRHFVMVHNWVDDVRARVARDK